MIKRPRQAWAQWISPETLIAQVSSTAPFLVARFPPAEPGHLIHLGNSPDGFLRILANWRNMLSDKLSYEEQLQSYFALCLACHHATVATFVPTDVDTKIRGIVWRESRDPDVLRPMLRLALASRAWTEDGISVRSVRGVSGHDGEHWSAIAGGLGRMLEIGDQVSADEAQAAIEAEIDREQAVFDAVAAERDAELDLLRLSMTLAHNRGDLTQGMGFWKKTPLTTPLMEHFAERGRFALAVRIYQHTGLSTEGHRHYPLRTVKALRRSPDTLLPLSPFLDEWGSRGGANGREPRSAGGASDGLQESARPAGLLSRHRGHAGGLFWRFRARRRPDAQRAHATCCARPKCANSSRCPRISFESMMRKRARTALALFGANTS